MNSKKNHQFPKKLPPLHQLNQHEYKKDDSLNRVELENIIYTLQRIETKIDVLLMQRHQDPSYRSDK